MSGEPSLGGGRDLDRKLDALFTAYRNAIPDPEPGPDFMSRLWLVIEAQRASSCALRRWAGVLVTAAATICVLLGILLTAPIFPGTPHRDSGYLEALAADSSSDVYPDFELVPVENEGGVR